MMETDFKVTTFHKIGSAVFHALTSFSIIVVNKIVLTTYQFPSFLFLALGQLIASLILLLIARQLKLVEFPNITVESVKKVFPLPLFYIGNMWFGLGGTQHLSLPMFTALRRISIFMTLILEITLLKSKPGWLIHTSVYTMIVGAFVAAVNDLSFQLNGYIYVFMTNVLTALYIVFIKKKLDLKIMGKYELMFYNSLFSMIPTIIVTSATGDFKKILKYDQWDNVWFLSCFFLSCIMGFLLALSTFLCTFYNSALTVTMVGSMKNVLVTFIGMFVGGDYIFSVLNCIGLSISATGSVLYTYAGFIRGKKSDSSENKDPVVCNVSSEQENPTTEQVNPTTEQVNGVLPDSISIGVEKECKSAVLEEKDVECKNSAQHFSNNESTHL